VRTIKPVEPDDTLTISYVDLLRPPRMRQAVLLRRYAFLCSCPACTGPFTAGAGQAQLWTVNAAFSEPAKPPAGAAAAPAPAAPDWQLEAGMGDLTLDEDPDPAAPYLQRALAAKQLYDEACSDQARLELREKPVGPVLPTLQVRSVAALPLLLQKCKWTM
jgi:hypothetical protein